jgi:hypothetical protein
MPWVGFEPTIPAFERAKTVHALDRAVIVIGASASTAYKYGTEYHINVTLVTVQSWTELNNEDDFASFQK